MFPLTMKHQGLDSVADKVRDPLLHRTFGGWMAGQRIPPVGQSIARNAGPSHLLRRARRRPLPRTPDAKTWLDSAETLSGTAPPMPRIRSNAPPRGGKRFGRDRGFSSTAIRTCSTSLAAMPCSDTSRRAAGAEYPIKFNGGIFTVEPKFGPAGLQPRLAAWGDATGARTLAIPTTPCWPPAISR